MELTCTSFSFPLLSFEAACRVISVLDIPAVGGGPSFETDAWWAWWAR